MGFANSAAFWSFIGIALSIVVLVIGFVYLWFCYFPGGYSKKDVMDLGEYAMFVAQMKHEERKKKVEKTEEEDYVNQYDELYYEMEPDNDHDRDHDQSEYDDKSSRRDGSDWHSVGTSEQQDIEGGEYYDGTSSSSPSSHSQSQSGYTFDNQSTLSPTSQATPSQRSLKSALKSSRDRDDRSESTYTSGYSSYR